MDKLQKAIDDSLNDPYLYIALRSRADHWHNEQVLQMKQNEKFDHKFEEANEMLSQANKKIKDSLSPIINNLMENLDDFHQECTISGEEKMWNDESKDVQYLENVKNEIEKKQFEKELNGFQSKKSKEISSKINQKI